MDTDGRWWFLGSFFGNYSLSVSFPPFHCQALLSSSWYSPNRKWTCFSRVSKLAEFIIATWISKFPRTSTFQLTVVWKNPLLWWKNSRTSVIAANNSLCFLSNRETFLQYIGCFVMDGTIEETVILREEISGKYGEIFFTESFISGKMDFHKSIDDSRFWRKCG